MSVVNLAQQEISYSWKEKKKLYVLFWYSREMVTPY